MKDVDVMERIVLMMGVWQLRYAPELPFQVVLSESVELANHFGSAQSHAYVNAVLDRAARAWCRAADSRALTAGLKPVGEFALIDRIRALCRGRRQWCCAGHR